MVIKQTCKYTLWYLHSKIKQVTQSRTNRNCTTNQRSVGDTKNIKSTDKTKHRSTEKTKCRSKDKTKHRTVRQRDINFFFPTMHITNPFHDTLYTKLMNYACWQMHKPDSMLLEPKSRGGEGLWRVCPSLSDCLMPCLAWLLLALLLTVSSRPWFFR